MRIVLAALVPLALVLPALLAAPPANAGLPVVDGEPLLRPDSQFAPTPWGYAKKGLALPAREKPAIFQMDGYAGAKAPDAYLRLDDGILLALRITPSHGPDGAYARVYASIRGTECSGGQFHLYDRRHAWDGHHAIAWIADQPWSNGSVGMAGWSFSGQTAYWVATTQPPALKAVSANLLHSDIYRDIFMVGGVQNYAFPVVWTYGMGVAGPHRLPVHAIENAVFAEDEICAANQLGRASAADPPQPWHEPAWAALGPTDNAWYQAHAATTYASAIRIPFYQQNNWHDEQTGPRAAVLWHHVHPDPVTIVGKDGAPRTVVPKVLRTANGDHGWGGTASREMWAWFDIWLRGMPDRAGILDAPVTNHFDMSESGASWSAVKTGASWPFPDTQWTRLYAREGGRLAAEAPAGDEPDDLYLSGVPRRGAWFFMAPEAGNGATDADALPDWVAYRSDPTARDLAVAGPIVLDLHATLLGTDTDFYVSLLDEAPDGRVATVQRGLLKASHRAVDPLRSHHNAAGETVQPVRPHTNPLPVPPGESVHYPIEVLPVGHVFREGHRLVVAVHTPPVLDGLWGFTPTHGAPAVVRVHHDAARPTSLLLPVVTPDGPIGPAPQACGVPGGFPCWTPT